MSDKKEEEERRAIFERLRKVHGLFPLIGEDEYYTGRLGIFPEARGMGLGRIAQDLWMREVEERFGLRKFRGDVYAEKQAAFMIYKWLGYEVIGETSSPDTGMKYYTVRCDRTDHAVLA